MPIYGVGLLGVVVGVDRHGAYAPPFPDFWIRGTTALLVVAVGIAALAVLERSLPFAAFALGFIGLALLSCLYDDVNLLQRVGRGACSRAAPTRSLTCCFPGCTSWWAAFVPGAATAGRGAEP